MSAAGGAPGHPASYPLAVVREQGIEEWVPAGMRRQGNGSDPDVWIDLNTVDFEELLALGIPIGQAARFISQRERRGGLRSVTDVDDFYGLVPSVRDTLRSRGLVLG